MTDFSTWSRHNVDSFAHQASELVKCQRKELKALHLRLAVLEDAMRRMLATVADYHCAGSSQYALGANATAELFAVDLEAIMQTSAVSLLAPASSLPMESTWHLSKN